MYTQEVKLQDNETLLIINKETGNIKEPKKRINNIPEGKELFEPKGIFRKDYTKTWKYLKTELTPFEFSVAFELALLAKANTNSLEPLSDDTTVSQLVEKFKISRNKVKPLFNKLFRLGVYAKFEVYDITKPYTKYWILNPYLSFSGKLINSDIAKLFLGTLLTKHYYDNTL